MANPYERSGGSVLLQPPCRFLDFGGVGGDQLHELVRAVHDI
jgi:hypothetical protein